MKKLAATLCIVGTAMALSACNTTGTGNDERGAPYSTERTASGDSAPAERVFHHSQNK